MGFLDVLFGGSEEQSSSSSIPSLLEILSPEQRQALEFLGPLLQSRISQGFQPSGLEQTSLEGLEGMANQFFSGQGGTAGSVAGSQSALMDLLNASPEDINPYLDETVNKPLMELLNEQLIPQQENKFAGNQNFFGGERVQAVRNTTEDVIGQIARERARAAMEEFQNVRNARLGALGLAPGIAGLESGIAGNFLGLGQGNRESMMDEQARRINQLLSFIGLPVNEVVNTQESSSSASSSDGIFSAIPIF